MKTINATAKMMVSFYNAQAGTAFRLGDNERKITIVTEAIDRMDGDLFEVKQQIRKYLAEHEKGNRNIWECFESIRKADATPTGTATDSGSPSEDNVRTSMNVLEQALVKIVAETSAKKIEEEIMSQVQETVRTFIKNEYGTVTRKIITVVDGAEVPSEEITHEKFGEVIKCVKNRIPVYLTGPAGSGKNHICQQVADALGLKFYFTNAVTQEYKLTGFTDATGKYQPTQFYKAFTEGGLFMLDEMDASIPDVLIILNAALANGYFDFPAPIGFKKMHKDFRVIAAGNTWGFGADSEYVGRSQIDSASLNRFYKIKIDYCTDIENCPSVCLGNIEVADFCRAFRNACKKNGLHVVVSYRNINHIATMIQISDIEDVLMGSLTAGLNKDDVNMIANELPISKFRTALQNIANKM